MFLKHLQFCLICVPLYSQSLLKVGPNCFSWAWCPTSHRGVGGCCEITLRRLSSELQILMRALLEKLKSGQSAPDEAESEAEAVACLAGVRAAGPCVLQISLISSLMDCPAPRSVSRGGVGGGGVLHSLGPLFSLRDMPSLGCTSNYSLCLPFLLYPNLLSGADCSGARGQNTKCSVSQHEAHSSQLGYRAQCALWDRGFHCVESLLGLSRRLQTPVWRTIHSFPRGVYVWNRINVYTWEQCGGEEVSLLHHAGPVGFSRCMSQSRRMTGWVVAEGSQTVKPALIGPQGEKRMQWWSILVWGMVRKGRDWWERRTNDKDI